MHNQTQATDRIIFLKKESILLLCIALIKGAVRDYIRKENQQCQDNPLQSDPQLGRGDIWLNNHNQPVTTKAKRDTSGPSVFIDKNSKLFSVQQVIPHWPLSITVYSENSQLAWVASFPSLPSSVNRTQINNHAETNRTALANTNQIPLCHAPDSGQDDKGLKIDYLWIKLLHLCLNLTVLVLVKLSGLNFA